MTFSRTQHGLTRVGLEPPCKGKMKDAFSGNFFRFFEITMFCFVVDINDLVHDVGAIFYLSYMLITSRFFFLKYE